MVDKEGMNPSLQVSQQLKRHQQSMRNLGRNLTTAINEGDYSEAMNLLNSSKEMLVFQKKIRSLDDTAAVHTESHSQKILPSTGKRPTPGMYLSIADFRKPLWEAVAAQQGKVFTLEDLREYIKTNYCLRAADLEKMSEGQPRWHCNTRKAFKYFVFSNADDYRNGRKDSYVLYLSNSAINGKPGRYSLTEAGKSEMARVLASRQSSTPSITAALS